jgi:hypothetical protein
MYSFDAVCEALLTAEAANERLREIESDLVIIHKQQNVAQIRPCILLCLSVAIESRYSSECASRRWRCHHYTDLPGSPRTLGVVCSAGFSRSAKNRPLAVLQTYSCL